jgi:hypothetical protein
MGKLTLKSEKKNKKRGKNNVSLYCCRFLILLRILGKEEGGLDRFAAPPSDLNYFYQILIRDRF